MTKTDASRIVGGLSTPSKMPGYAFGLPARMTCPVGDRLAQVPGTPCSTCYATRGFYVMRGTQAAELRRYEKVRAALADPEARVAWIDAMVTLLSGETYFRWHDSGDVFSRAYLDLIVDVVRRTPTVRHWLPTQERAMVSAWMRDHMTDFPANLTVRISMTKVDPSPESIEATHRAMGLPTSSVSTTAPTCPSRLQGNQCRDCRACWDSSVAHVAYAKH